MLVRLYELKEETKAFMQERGKTVSLDDFCNPDFELQFAYLVDIFAHLNQLNLQLQGSGNIQMKDSANIFKFEDKMRAFISKKDLWIAKAEKQNYRSFPTFEKAMNASEDGISSNIPLHIIDHLNALKVEFNRYFPEFSAEHSESVRTMVRNPFIVNAIDLPDEIQEEVIELQNDRSCKESFDSDISLEEFWCKRAKAYPTLRDIAIRFLVQFSTTHLCEQGFSSLVVVKTKQRNRLDCRSDMRIALSQLEPRIDELVKSMRAQKSSSK
ncbi:MAG: hypothetical protein EOP45_15050 [Sphingobacteriaceae bacterium]|nr:MAG: hypothetical protein EOP45_15050 [Sphingobacteriaceae bacterium]